MLSQEPPNASAITTVTDRAILSPIDGRKYVVTNAATNTAALPATVLFRYHRGDSMLLPTMAPRGSAKKRGASTFIGNANKAQTATMLP
mmetsp:Transcript_20208/g.40511  ORF Transcript_20208/g.40511 Transcript_20208/m.40511 type:complete len:89 (+) Transcript_20208:115-381(+)